MFLWYDARGDEMNTWLLLIVCIIFAGVFLNNLSNKIGMPVLLAFMLLGIMFGCEGVVKIPFDNFEAAGNFCSIALVVIMFYGGFTTRFEMARPVCMQAILLASLGVIGTVGFTAWFIYAVFHLSFEESLLIASVIGSTDAASVFSILRARRLNLKYNTASMLEMESGSNDPCSYMCTVVAISLLNKASISVGTLLLQQVLFGLLFGFGLAYLFKKICSHIEFAGDGFDMLFLTGIALCSYALPQVFNGNGYLSAYIVGIVLGNSDLDNKANLVAYFDGVTGIVQLSLFFLLGLLSYPSHLLEVADIGLYVSLFMMFVARPIVVSFILMFFKATKEQMLVVSFAGLRGAASICFAIMAIMKTNLSVDLYHIVFFIVLFSILVQGSLLPWVCRKLNFMDDKEDVLKTFTDYQEEVPVRFVETSIPSNHPWCNKMIQDIILPPKTLIVLLQRGDERIVPNGKTVLQTGDRMIVSALAPSGKGDMKVLKEVVVDTHNKVCGKKVKELPRVDETLIVLVERNEEALIPDGDLTIQEGDTLVITSRDSMIV